jgi:hypothetical protein
MNSNKDGVQYNARPMGKVGFYGGGDQGQRIQGYVGGGIPTGEFSQATGRAPTAGDYEALNGGLSPAFPQMGSLPNAPHGMTTTPAVAQPAGPATMPTADKTVNNVLAAAGNAASNSFFPTPSIGQPYIPNAGQTMTQPKQGIYGTDEAARQKRMALRNGTYGT